MAQRWTENCFRYDHCKTKAMPCSSGGYASSKMQKKTHVCGLYVCLAVVLIMLVCAVARRNPYSFYTLLRWICCACLAYSAFASRLLGQAAWSTVFGIEAVLFNPLVEFHFRRGTWQTLDKLAIASTIIAAVAFRRKFNPDKQRENVLRCARSLSDGKPGRD